MPNLTLICVAAEWVNKYGGRRRALRRVAVYTHHVLICFAAGCETALEVFVSGSAMSAGEEWSLRSTGISRWVAFGQVF